MKTWKYGDMNMEYGNMGTLKHRGMDMKSWTWRHEHRNMDMETWTTRHGHEDMDMETWT